MCTLLPSLTGLLQYLVLEVTEKTYTLATAIMGMGWVACYTIAEGKGEEILAFVRNCSVVEPLSLSLFHSHSIEASVWLPRLPRCTKKLPSFFFFWGRDLSTKLLRIKELLIREVKGNKLAPYQVSGEKQVGIVAVAVATLLSKLHLPVWGEREIPYLVFVSAVTRTGHQAI